LNINGTVLECKRLGNYVFYFRWSVGLKLSKKINNYRRYPQQYEEDLLTTSGILHIIYRYLSRRFTLRQAIEEATLLYEYRRNKASVASIRYYFFSFILAHIRLIDWMEKKSKGTYQENLQQGGSRTKNGLISLRQTVALLPGVFAEIIGDVILEIKRAWQEQKEKRKKKKEDLEVFKTSKVEDIVIWFRLKRQQLTSRRFVYFIVSIFLHIIIFFLLQTYTPQHQPKILDPFEMNAIQLVDATPRAKDEVSTKGDEKKGERKRERSSEEPGKPQIHESPKADIRTTRKEDIMPLDRPGESIPVKEIAQKEPEFQEKDIFKPDSQPQQRQLTMAKNISPQQRSRANIPDTMKTKKQYDSKVLMKRRPISPKVAARGSARTKDLAMAESVNSLSHTHQASLAPRMESSNFSQKIRPLKQKPLAEKENVITRLPGKPDFEKFTAEKTVDIKRKKTTLTRTRQSFQPKKAEHRSKIDFRRAEIADITVPKEDKADKEDLSSHAIRGKKEELLSGVKKKDSPMTGMALTLRTPLRHQGFTVGDLPQKKVEKEEATSSQRLRHSQVESPKGVKYFGRMAKKNPLSFTEERVTYKPKSRAIIKRMPVKTDELGNIEELEDFSEEASSSPVNMLNNLNKRTFSSTESFASPTASQYSHEIKVEEGRKIQKAKSFTKADTYRDEKKDSLAQKKLAYKTDKISKPILKKELNKKSSPVNSEHSPKKRSTKVGTIEIKAALPSGYITQDALYTLRGEIGSDVKRAFVTINDVTQMVTVKDGLFMAKLAMAKGINKVNIMAFSSKGKIGNKAYKLLFHPRKAVPFVQLLSPVNGSQGSKEGDKILVAGTISDTTIKQAILLLNNTKIRMKVKNGKFKHKVFLPGSRVNTFRVSATSKNGMTGYSNLHTILIGADFDINNPRPY